MRLSDFGKPLPPTEKRLILGEPTQQLFPLKYPWMRDIYKKAKSNHWEPEDINMTKDIYNYKHDLSDSEKLMFDWGLSMLTTQDLLVLGNLEEAIERHLTCPEASLYLARQSAEEAIHTDSYQYIIESLTLDETTVYQRYLMERTLFDKIAYAHTFHRRLLELRMDDHSDFSGISEFMICVAFWAMCMEGGFFYTGFLWVYALRRRNLMPGTTEMFQYIQRDEGLHMEFWLTVLNELIHEYPEAYTAKVQHTIESVLRDTAYLEEKYAYDLCRGVVGITPKDYMQHFKHRLNLNASRIGLDKIFSDVAPLGWVSEFELIPEGNFFEVKIREYSKSGLDWGSSDDGEQFESVLPL